MSRSTAKTKVSSVFKPSGSAEITGTNSQLALLGMIDEIYDDKQDLVASPTNGNLVKTDGSGQTQDSGISASAVSGHLSDTDIRIVLPRLKSDLATWITQTT